LNGAMTGSRKFSYHVAKPPLAAELRERLLSKILKLNLKGTVSLGLSVTVGIV
jgi:hypothetical protein